MPYAPDQQGRPVFLISNMAMHTQNLKADARASLLVMQESGEADPLGAARITLVGEVLPVPETETGAAGNCTSAATKTPAIGWISTILAFTGCNRPTSISSAASA